LENEINNLENVEINNNLENIEINNNLENVEMNNIRNVEIDENLEINDEIEINIERVNFDIEEFLGIKGRISQFIENVLMVLISLSSLLIINVFLPNYLGKIKNKKQEI
jgi:hypothetical protein